MKDNSLTNSGGERGGGGGGGGGCSLITYGKLMNFTAHLCRQRLDTFLSIGEREVL